MQLHGYASGYPTESDGTIPRYLGEVTVAPAAAKGYISEEMVPNEVLMQLFGLTMIEVCAHLKNAFLGKAFKTPEFISYLHAKKMLMSRVTAQTITPAQVGIYSNMPMIVKQWQDFLFPIDAPLRLSVDMLVELAQKVLKKVCVWQADADDALSMQSESQVTSDMTSRVDVLRQSRGAIEQLEFVGYAGVPAANERILPVAAVAPIKTIKTI